MEHGSHEGGGHHEHGGPMLSFDEFLKAHPPGPPSYIAHDLWPTPEDELSGWPSLMLIHILSFSLAFFVLLPASISLRSVKHRWHAPVWAAFHVLTSVGLFSATLYNKLTPDFYTGSKHGRMGYAVAGIVASLWLADCLTFIQGLIQALARHPPERWSLVEITRCVFGSREQDGDRAEYTNLVQQEDVEEVTLEAYPAAEPPQQKEEEEEPMPVHTSRSPPPVSIITSHSRSHSRSVSFSVSDELESGRVEQWRQHGSPYSSPSSNNSDLTLHDSGATPTTPKKPQAFPLPDTPISWRRRLSKAPQVLFHTVEHALVPLAFATSLDGVVTYTGLCRANEINVCMAHLVKGSIFYCYGLLSFARYLGAWKKLGWAWNRATVRNAPSAEMVECLVIFLYGATNTWMKRFGSKAGDPYSTRQIQHISIAVMFWFAGAIGMTLESRAVRAWLSGTSAHDVPQDAPSFNPMPGLVIAVTGLVMSAHHQETQFLVDIHVLWGTLLALFAAMRWVTYLLLWVKSKTGRAMATTEPSRPPSEVLASFCLSCGGIAFVLSMEPIGVEAIRAGHDDVMVFMTFAVSLTCFSFLWMLAVMAFNGFVKTRAAAETAIGHPQSAHRRSQSP